MNIIQLNEIDKEFKTSGKVLSEINLTINSGEMVSIVGPSGSGKTTLLNIIGCIELSTNGTYQLKGNDVSMFNDKQLSYIRNKEFGFVVQDFALIEEYSVKKNILIPTEYSKIKDKKAVAKKLNELLEKFEIEEKINEKVSLLSGGQKQRVGIIRALINNPSVILADEPTGSLDSKNSQTVFDILREINLNLHKTIIIVTHELSIANQCDRIIELFDGKIIKDRRINQLQAKPR